MNPIISNNQQSIYKLTINFESLLVLEYNYIDLSLVPISFLSNTVITNEIIVKNEQIQQLKKNNSDSTTDCTTFLFIDLQTGLCWDTHMCNYTCWLTAMTDSVNDELCYLKDIQVRFNQHERGGLFKVENFSTRLIAELI